VNNMRSTPAISWSEQHEKYSSYILEWITWEDLQLYPGVNTMRSTPAISWSEQHEKYSSYILEWTTWEVLQLYPGVINMRSTSAISSGEQHDKYSSYIRSLRDIAGVHLMLFTPGYSCNMSHVVHSRI
jgi:hypothetical protein